MCAAGSLFICFFSSQISYSSVTWDVWEGGEYSLDVRSVRWEKMKKEEGLYVLFSSYCDVKVVGGGILGRQIAGVAVSFFLLDSY